MAEAVDKQLLTENAQPPERESPRPDGMPRAATNVTCFRCQQRGHRVAECPSKDSALSTRQITCFAYQKKGHYASDCPSVQHRRNESNIKTKPKSSVSMIQSDAPSNSAEQVDDTLDAQLQRVESQLRALQFQKAQKEGSQVRGVKPPAADVHTVSGSGGPLVYARVTAGGVEVDALVDTGSSVSISGVAVQYGKDRECVCRRREGS